MTLYIIVVIYVFYDLLKILNIYVQIKHQTDGH